MSGSWAFPCQFDRSAPASDVLPGAGVVVQVVEHGAVVVTSILVNGRQDLRRMSKSEHRTDVYGPVDVLSPFCSAVMDHGSILGQDVSEMYTGGDVGEVPAIELKWGRIVTEVHVTTHIDNLGFGLGGIFMDTEADVVLGGELFTDLQHPHHSTAGGGEEKEIICVGGGAHEDPGDVAAHSGESKLLQEVIQV